MEPNSDLYSFEVASGPVGINLQSVKDGNGVFIESFYRSSDGATLAAEKCGVVLIGDRLEFVNNVSVWGLPAEAVRERFVLSAARGPFSVTVRRIHNNPSLAALVGDPRCSSWLNLFLQLYCLPLEADKVARKIGLMRTIQTVLSWQAFPHRDHAKAFSSATNDAKRLCTECIIRSLENELAQDIPEALVVVVRLLVHDDDVPLATLLDAVRCVLGLLEKELARTLLLKFENCSLAKQMSGWLSESPAFSPVAMTDILRVDALLVLYYLFLCQSGRHRLVGALLRKRRMARVCVASLRAAEDSEELKKTIILEAARDDLLFEFHASAYFDNLLKAARGRSVPALLAEVGSVLQQVLRSVPLPPGVSFHRRKVRSDSITEEATEAATVHIVLFRTTFGGDGIPPSTHISASASACVSATGECTVVNGCPFEEDINLAAPFLLPTGTFPSGEKLFSYVVAQKNGAYMYGASHIQPYADEYNDEVRQAPLTVLKDKIPCTDADTGGDVDAGRDSILTSVFARGPPTQALSRMTDGAEQLLRGIRQWGESSLPPVVRVPSLSSVRSFSTSTPTASSTEPTTPLTPFLWEMGSTLSSVWMKPTAARLETQAEDVDDPDYGLWDAGVVATSKQSATKHGGAFGVALLSTRPAVDTLRKVLCLFERNRKDWTPASAGGDAALELTQLLSKPNVLQELSAPVGIRHAAADFDPKAVYEVLTPQNLATIFCAALLEFKILLVSTEHVTLALLVGEWLKLAMGPLEWCHIYAPVVPHHIALELVQCPAPYLLGVARETLRAARAVPPRDAVVVDLDNGTVRVPAELKVLLPAMAVLVKDLVGALQPHSSRCDRVDSEWGGGDADVLSICHNFVRNLLCPVQTCVVVLEVSDELLAALDEEKFVRKARAALGSSDSGDGAPTAAADLFLRRLIRSQSFSENLLTVATQAREE